MSSAVSSSRGSFLTAGTGSLDSVRSFGQFEASEMDPSEENEPELLSLSWNQDYQCFAAGTSHGLRIYDCDPFKETFRRNLKSGFSIVEMLFRSNVMALVGGGSNPQYPPNKVMIWDDHQNRCLVEYAYRSNIRAVKLRQDRIVVVLEHKINVYDFSDLKLIHQIETISNPRGLCCLSHYANTSVLAFPGLHRGQVQVKHFGLKVTKFISAHDSQLACLTLTLDGFLLATASVKGTLIRIFNTMDGTLLQEVRRGADKADIYNLALSPTVRWLAVSSDKGTVHIFSLRVRIVGEDSSNQNVIGHGPQLVQQNSSSSLDTLISPKMGANTSSSLSFMKGVLPKYFSSEWSFAQFHLPEATRYTVAFGAQNTVIIIGLDGSFYKCSFDPVNGGEMVQQEYIRFIKNDNHRPIPPTS